ncbi:MAG: 30S ribosomal protein S17 [Candidatus Hodgkinia cicadicola]
MVLLGRVIKIIKPFTLVTLVTVVCKHSKYGKYIKKHKTYFVYAKRLLKSIGDSIKFKSCAPLSVKTKWCIVRF